MATTARKVFEGIQTELRELLADTMNPKSIYLISVPRIDPTDLIAVQIVPGRRVNKGRRSSSPLIEVQFDIVVWLMSLGDYGSEDTGKLIDDTWSAYEIIDQVQSKLIMSDADGEATIAITWIDGDKPITNPAQQGWVTITDHYQLSFTGSHR